MQWHRRDRRASALVVIALVAFVAVDTVSEIMICNYEKFNLYDGMYRPRTANFCVFNDVYLANDVKATDFLASSLDYKRVAFANSKFPAVPPSLFKNFDDIRELYVRRCSLVQLRITRQLETVYAGSNRIASVVLDGNGSNNLKELYLDNNRMRDVANLTFLPNLQVLVLENNPLLGSVDFAKFGRMEHLSKLDLERTGMTKVVNSLKHNLTELQRLDLSNNLLTYVHMRMFESFPSLEHLWLHGNRLYYMEVEHIRSYVPAIRSIIIDDNYWGCGHLAAIGRYLRDHGIVIRHSECKSRSAHKVCCSEGTEVVDFRYIIEMNIRKETKFEQDLLRLRRANEHLKQDVERMRDLLEGMRSNLSASVEPPGSSSQQVSLESSNEYEN